MDRFEIQGETRFGLYVLLALLVFLAILKFFESDEKEEKPFDLHALEQAARFVHAHEKPPKDINPADLQPGQAWLRFELSGGGLESPWVFQGAHAAWRTSFSKGLTRIESADLAGVKGSDGKSFLDSFRLSMVDPKAQVTRRDATSYVTLGIKHPIVSVKDDAPYRLRTEPSFMVHRLPAHNGERRYQFRGQAHTDHTTKGGPYQLKGFIYYKPYPHE